MNLQDLTEYYPDERYQPIHPRLDECFKAIEVLGNLTHFTKVENEVTQYHKVGIGQPTSSLKLADYNYLNDSVNAEDFKDVKKGENPEELDC